MRPQVNLLLDGSPLELYNRLIALSVIDKNGMEVDELTLELDDSDGQLQMPSKGKQITVIFGFAGQEQNRGDYIVDELSHRGPPDVLSIRARSADFKRSLLEEREQSYHQTTVGAIISTIAGRHGLKAAVAGELASIKVEHLDQTNESDANLITRLAKEHDAVGTVKSGQLLFIVRAAGQTASGQPLPEALIQRREGDSHEYSNADRDERVTGVIAYWHDKPGGKRRKVESGSSGYRRHLKHTYNSEAEAKAAASAEHKRIRTRALKLNLRLAVGRAELFAEQPVKVEGFKAEIDAVHWFVREISHHIDGQGYTCSLNLEEMAGAGEADPEEDYSARAVAKPGRSKKKKT